MVSSSTAERLGEDRGTLVQGPKPGSPVDRILNRECEGDELIASLKEDPAVDFDSLQIDFNEDLWDFTGATDVYINKSLLKISFADIPMKDEIKLFALTQLLWETAKIQSINVRVRNIEEWARDLGLEPGNVRLLDATKVGRCIDAYRARVCASYLGNKTRDLLFFLRLYEQLWGRLVDKEALEVLEETSVVCDRMAREADGWPAIPCDYLEPLMETARSVMADESAMAEDRITAAVIILLERLGFRIGECLALETGSVEVVPGPGDMPDIANLSFRTWKGKRKNGATATGKTAVDAASLEAYLTLERICEPRRGELGVSTLIVYPQQQGAFISRRSISTHFSRFLLRNKDRIPCVNSQESFPELRSVDAASAACNSHARKSPELRAKQAAELAIAEGDVLVYPVFHSFRVSFATRLYESGLDFQIIAKLMNQVSEDMAASYVRSDKRIEREYSGAVYQAMLEDDARLLGSHADEFAAKVAEYASELKGEVCGDVDEIIGACAEHYPLRRKVGGVCIRCGNVVECPSNSPTDQVFCAFGVCPNQCHIFFMADVQLGIVREHIALVEENARRGHARAAENELRKARNVLEGMLLPELAELDRQLELHGAEHVLKRHPQLTEIVENREEIDREVASWQGMQL